MNSENMHYLHSFTCPGHIDLFFSVQMTIFYTDKYYTSNSAFLCKIQM